MCLCFVVEVILPKRDQTMQRGLLALRGTRVGASSLFQQVATCSNANHEGIPGTRTKRIDIRREKGARPDLLSAKRKEMDPTGGTDSVGAAANAAAMGDANTASVPPELLDKVAKSSHREISEHDEQGSSVGAAGGSGGGYKFFEDHFVKKEDLDPLATRKFEYYEDQQASPGVTDEYEEKEETLNQKLRRLHNPKHYFMDKDGAIHQPADYGWNDKWGPAPGKKGHKAWYNKDRKYMSNDEKHMMDTSVGRPVMQRGEWRNMTKTYSDYMAPTMGDMIDSTADDGQTYYDKWGQSHDAPGTTHDFPVQMAHDNFGKKREEFINKWLEKPGVTKQNMSTKMMEHEGIDHKVDEKIAKGGNPDWELAPRGDDEFE